MAVTEEERHELHSWLEAQAGPQIAATLMKHLPSVGWMDVTTNTELEHVRRELTDRIDRVEASLGARIDRVEASLGARIDRVEASLGARIDVEIGGFRAEVAERLERQTRAMVLAMVGSMATITSLVLAITGLAG